MVQHSTDEHGWQYRSQWPRFALEPTDESWTNQNNPKADVRRRLWMTTVVKRDDVLTAKRKISDLIYSRQRGIILHGPLLRLENGEHDRAKVWIVRKAALIDDRIELYDEETNRKVADLPILGRQIKMLDGFAFSIREIDGSSCIIFDTDSKETRRRWLVAISYQIAVRGPLIDFAPFPYAPPLGEDGSNRTIVCGEMLKKGQSGMNWRSRFFKLTPRELQYFDRETLKGSVKVDGAILKYDDKSLELSIKSKSDVSMVLKAPSAETKMVWITALESQINAIEQKIVNAARAVSAEDRALTVSDGVSVGTIVIPSVSLQEAELEVNPPTTSDNDSHPLLAPFMSRVADPVKHIFLALNNSQVSTKLSPDTSPVKLSDILDPVDDIPLNMAAPEPVEFEEDENDEEELVLDDEDYGEEVSDDEEGEDDDGDMKRGIATAADGSPIPVRSVSVDLSSDVLSGGFGPASDGAKSWSKRNTNHHRSSRSAKCDLSKRKYKFGIQPDVVVSVDDFGVAPELLTTAQKVAILESQAFQNKNFSPIMPPSSKAGIKHTTYTALAPSTVSTATNKATASEYSPTSPGGANYVPTGLRVNDLDKEATNVENDGGPVAKTNDKLMDKISKWEDWTKNIGNPPPGTKSPTKLPPK